jgi:outer membrane lipoprotein-sorting protein
MSILRTPAPLLLAATVMAMLGACQREASSAPDAATATSATSAAPAALADAAANAVSPLNAKDEIGKAMNRFLGVKSYHATMDASTGKGAMTIEMDFVAPDRYRMQTPMGTQYVIGDTMYMTAQGRTMKVPLPKGQITGYRDPASFEANKATMTVEALGGDSVDGQPAKKYLLRATQPKPGESMLWVDAAGYPLKIEVTGNAGGTTTRTTIRYSRFNDPAIRIEPPQ